MSSKVTYQDIEDIVEYLVSKKSSMYRFGYYESDDIAQEIRLICLEKLDKLDTSQPREKWKNFFGRCVDNSLKNLKRDKYVRVSSLKKKHDALKKDDKSKEAQEIREKWQREEKKIKRRLALQHPLPVDDYNDVIQNRKFNHEMEYKEMERFLLEKAEGQIVENLEAIFDGRISSLSDKQRRKVQAFVKETLDA